MSTIAVNTITPASGSSVSIPAFVPDGQFSFRNRIINGSMDIAQRGTSFAAAAAGTFVVDRWSNNYTTTGVTTLSQQADVPSNNEFQNSARVAVTTADTSIAAGDFYFIEQKIEGYNVRDLIGRAFTVSFWVRSSKTGTHCMAFRNSGSDRSYVAEYTVNAANTWEQKSITVSGGLITAGTWDWTNGIGVTVRFTLMAGTTFQTTAGAWQTGNFLATANQVNCLDSNTNIFAITGVQLEAGSVATPFEHRPIGAELALCQRYFEKSWPQSVAPANGANSTSFTGDPVSVLSQGNLVNVSYRFAVVKRATPTITYYGNNTGQLYVANTGAAGTWTTVAGNINAGANEVGIAAYNSSTALQHLSFHFIASAEL